MSEGSALKKGKNWHQEGGGALGRPALFQGLTVDNRAGLLTHSCVWGVALVCKGAGLHLH